MDFNKANDFEKEKQSNKKILVIAVTLIVILAIAATSIYFYTANARKKLLKVYINAVNWSRYGDTTVVDKKRLAGNSVIKEGNKYYFAIKDFAEVAGFNFYRGDRTTEEETKAYIENNSERVTFVSGSKEIRKYYLTSSYSSGKNSNLTSQVFNIDDTILFKNGKLYISENGIGRAFNVLFKYNQSSNNIQIYTLEYFYSLMSGQIKDLFKVNSNTNNESKVVIDNKKALLYNYVINYDEATGLYGMALLSDPTKLIISKKYKQIDYVEGSDDFIVTTVDGKVGILGKDSLAKVDPKYDSIENIDLNAGLYLVKLYEKYGVVTQMGKIVVSVDYDQIGLDSNIDDKNLTSRYLLYDNCIPVKLLGKWGFYDKNGNKIVDTEYDSIGCYRVQNADGNAQPLVIIPDLNGIVLGKKFESANKSSSQILYGIVDKTGQMIINLGAESIYKVVFNNNTSYYYYTSGQSIDIVKAWREEMKKRELGEAGTATNNTSVQGQVTNQINDNGSNQVTTQNTNTAVPQSNDQNNAQNNTSKGIEEQNNSQVQNQDESATAVVPSSTTNG
ncbi:MAG: WG repeat-containing protein [Clostridiales bacterium]|jgi:hypothetical protein|nr:WG repeat-containing protein [Clostridiales bacterium]MBF0926738.1 WG repeat-containing protein [Clostridiales bacterium]MBF0978797.1 WG repeat-containing protein [Clostridiales bacterium]